MRVGEGGAGNARGDGAGGEGSGPSRGVARACGRRLAVPLAEGIESLNVAVALGVLLFEAVRQRRCGPNRP